LLHCVNVVNGIAYNRNFSRWCFS